MEMPNPSPLSSNCDVVNIWNGEGYVQSVNAVVPVDGASPSTITSPVAPSPAEDPVETKQVPKEEPSLVPISSTEVATDENIPNKEPAISIEVNGVVEEPNNVVEQPTIAPAPTIVSVPEITTTTPVAEPVNNSSVDLTLDDTDDDLGPDFS